MRGASTEESICKRNSRERGNLRAWVLVEWIKEDIVDGCANVILQNERRQPHSPYSWVLTWRNTYQNDKSYYGQHRARRGYFQPCHSGGVAVVGFQQRLERPRNRRCCSGLPFFGFRTDAS